MVPRLRLELIPPRMRALDDGQLPVMPAFLVSNCVAPLVGEGLLRARSSPLARHSNQTVDQGVAQLDVGRRRHVDSLRAPEAVEVHRGAVVIGVIRNSEPA